MNREECRKLLKILGPILLTECASASINSITNYLAGRGGFPPEIRERLEFLHELVSHLENAYNERGICHWLCRPRTQLNNYAPDQIFANDWSPEDPMPQKVLALAKTLDGPGDAT